jgi:outer membrane receptor protein involved in Fe transport
MHSTISIRLALMAIAATSASSARADEVADSADPVIVVTGGGLAQTPAAPAHDSVEIDRQALERAASGRLEDVLAGVAGFQQFRRSDSRSSNPSAQGVTLRALGGNATSRALVLLDGVPMADPFFGYIPFSAIDPGQLSGIRVTRGGGPSAFGAGAIGGTIELDSADAAQLGLVTASALVDDRGETELTGSLAPELGSGFAVVSARWDRGQGFWTTPVAQRVPASVKARYDSWSAGLRIATPLTDNLELQAHGLTFDDNRTLRFQGADSESRGSDASVRLVGHGAWQFDALAYVQIRDFSNVVISSTAFRKTLDQRKTPSTGLGGKFELRPPVGGAHVARIGIDFRRSSGGLQEEAYSAVTGAVTARRRAGGRNDDLGLFAQDDWTIGSLVLTAGGRADRWSIDDGYFTEANAAGTITTSTVFANRSGWDVSLRGGAVFRPSAALALRATGYTGLRLPTLNELYRPFVVFPVTTRANAALANERLRGFDAGIDFIPADGVKLSITAFDNRVNNAIANVTIGTNLRERRNVDAIHARGIELSAGGHIGALGFDGSLAWTDAKVEASGASVALNGKRPAQTPRIAASATLSWQPCADCTVAATVRHVGLQFEDDLEIDSLPAVTTLDAYIAFPLAHNVALVLRGENLTDRQIITRNQAGSIDLGAPRTLWVGLRFGRR